MRVLVFLIVSVTSCYAVESKDAVKYSSQQRDALSRLIEQYTPEIQTVKATTVKELRTDIMLDMHRAACK